VDLDAGAAAASVEVLLEGAGVGEHVVGS
jgi:hypothetical protein